MFKYPTILMAFISLSAFGQNYNTGLTYDRTTSKAAPITVYYPTLNNYVRHFVAGTTPAISWNTNEYGLNITADTTFTFSNIPTDTNLVRRIHFFVVGDGSHFLTNTVDSISWQTDAYIPQSGMTNEYMFEWNMGVINAWMKPINPEIGSHASPSTTTPLSPTWRSPMLTVWYGATGTINLPAAANYSGRAILIYNTGAFTITIDSNSSEVIVRDGNVQTGGVNFTLSSGAGNYVAMICDGTRWITLGYKGTLAVGS